MKNFIYYPDAADAPFKVQQILREPRYTRGDTNVRKVQPIDYADWIWMPECEGDMGIQTPKTFRFKSEFTADGTDLEFDISADERFTLFIDGILIARGPDRAASIENWMYHSYSVSGLSAGKHLIEAVCWTHWNHSPLAQLTLRGGFVFKAYGQYDKCLTTVDGSGWEVGEIKNGWKLYNGGGDCWGCGSNIDSTGCGLAWMQPDKWEKPVVVRSGGGSANKIIYGLRTNGWMLFPTQLLSQMEAKRTPGIFKAATDKITTENDIYTADCASHPLLEKFNSMLTSGEKITLPANTKVSLCWDLDNYYGAYPMLVTSGGKGSIVKWGWSESLFTEDGHKNIRSEFAGKRYIGTFDTFRMDGRKNAVFSTQWWRCGRWCELKIETGAEPLDIDSLYISESRYPLERESEFKCDDSTFDGIQRICARVMQSCDHEMLFDGPYYEQQMYPGDTRVQLLSLTSLSRDDRMIRRAIETYDIGQRDDGMIPFNAPSRGTQEGATYTQCWLLMFGDYAMYHDNKDWLKARIPGMRKALSAFEIYENNEGILGHLPGWSFMDWDKNWEAGDSPSSDPGNPPSSIINLFYILDLQSAAKAERACGNEVMAKAWESKIPAIKQKILAKYWCAEKGMLADDIAHSTFSEHAQCLGILTDVLEGETAQAAFEGILAPQDDKFARCTVYFSHYLFQTYFKMKRPDLFMKRLDLWRGYVNLGLSTTLESPESDGRISRSDCHAWGSHPLYWMQAGLAGISPAKEFFKEVRIAPQPGNLTFIKAKAPHPNGYIEIDLKFKDGKATGTINTPVPGIFAFGDKEIVLTAGNNVV